MAATKTMLTGGGFQDGEGNPLALGYLTMKLNQDASVSGVGNICSGIEITIQLDVNGNVVTSPAQSVWANTGGVLAPINTFYKVTGYTAAGQRAWGLNNQQVAAGATFNLSSWVPNSVISWFPTIGATPLAVEVRGAAFSSTTLLNFESSDSSVTITDEGSGLLNFQSAGNTKPYPTGGALGLWPGNWIGWNAAGVLGGTFTSGAELGMAVVSTGSNGGNISPTATQPMAYPIILADIGLTNSYSVSDQNHNITLGILTDWFTKVLIVGNTYTRFWFGVSDFTYTSAEPVLNSDTPAANIVGFRWSAGTDINIKAVCQTDATHHTIVDTGVTPDLSTPQVLEIVPTSNGTVITFYINRVLVATISTNVPATTVTMGSLSAGDGQANGSSNGQWNTYYMYALLNS